MVIRMRHTRAHTRNRRSHHALKNKLFGLCSNCKEKKQSHIVCTNCGFYNGRQVIDVVKKAEKKQEK
ncbi:MAG: 50S ribosomal protein L32 [Patescibacteria group bacterium]|nr:50S ribosomal protein L32 [Patescibacteria group bacterium]